MSFAPPVYRDYNGLWFWRCALCHAFEGAYRMEAEATTELWTHMLRRHP